LSKPRRLVTVSLIVTLLALAAIVGSLAPSGASSHREAPLISADPLADNTDVYVFRSPDRPDTVTLIANWIPFEEPAGGPNFFVFGDKRFGGDVTYTINVDNDGDAVDDIVYEFRFTSQIRNPNSFLYNTGPITSITDPDFNIRQTYSVARVEHGRRTILASGLSTPPDNVGPRSTPNYPALARQAVHGLRDGSKVFSGQRNDSFFVDQGSFFDLLGLRPLNPAHVIPLPKAPGVDGLSGYGIHTIALQVPIARLTHNGKPPTGPSDPNAIIGVYSETLRRQVRVLSPTGAPPGERGPFVQVSRLGMPLVNEVVIPLRQKDHFNASEPENDTQFLRFIRDPEAARLLPVLYPGVTVPPPPRSDLVTIFLTGIPGLNQPANVTPSEMIRLNMAVPPSAHPNPLGVLGGDLAGFPNGRRLADDVTDIELRALAGGTPLTPAFNHPPNNTLTDGVDRDERGFLDRFPYVGTPFSGYDSPLHRSAVQP
jgi:hypothetical protein